MSRPTERAIMMWQGKSNFVDKPYQTFPNRNCLYVVIEYLSDSNFALCIKVLSGLPVAAFSYLSTFIVA